MRLFEHLLKNSYAFLLAFCLIFLIGPKFISISKEKKELIQDNQITKMKLDYLNQQTTNYLTFEAELNNKTHKISFRKGDGRFSNLEKYFIKSSNRKTLDLPIEISDSVLNTIMLSRIEIGDKNELVFLKLENYVLIGKERTRLGKAVLFIMGIAFIIMGIILTILSVLALLNSIKVYKKTGKLINSASIVFANQIYLKIHIWV